MSLPHLSGLAHTARIAADDRVGTAGVFASGRLLVDPHWFLEHTDRGGAFVLAHELLHLALHTHTRVGDADPARFNAAHDLIINIINDMLETELGMRPPGGGIRLPGARHLSAEALMMEPSLDFQGPPDTAFGAAMREAMGRRGHDLDPQLQASPDDVLDEHLAAQWFPDETPRPPQRKCLGRAPGTSAGRTCWSTARRCRSTPMWRACGGALSSCCHG